MFLHFLLFPIIKIWWMIRVLFMAWHEKRGHKPITPCTLRARAHCFLASLRFAHAHTRALPCRARYKSQKDGFGMVCASRLVDLHGGLVCFGIQKKRSLAALPRCHAHLPPRGSPSPALPRALPPLPLHCHLPATRLPPAHTFALPPSLLHAHCPIHCLHAHAHACAHFGSACCMLPCVSPLPALPTACYTHPLPAVLHGLPYPHLCTHLPACYHHYSPPHTPNTMPCLYLQPATMPACLHRSFLPVLFILHRTGWGWFPLPALRALHTFTYHHTLFI